MPSNARYRNICFTLNNPTDPIPFDVDKMHYLVYQREVGASGTPHFQGYCEFKKQSTLSTVKALLGSNTVHIEPRRGTVAEAVAYCKKDDTRVPGTEPVEFGEPKQQGQRTDLEGFKDAVKAGKRKRDLVDDHFTVLAKYPKFYETLSMMNRPVRTTDLEVHLLIGETGLGKTRSVYTRHEDESDFWIAPLSNGTTWYDTYDGHKIVLLDDFAGASNHLTLATLLRLLDRYPVLVPVKGTFTWWLPDIIYVTSNIHPADWYKWDKREHQYKALARRFTKVLVFSTEGTTEAGTPFWDNRDPSDSQLNILN